MQVESIQQTIGSIRGPIAVRAWRTATPGLVIHLDIDGRGRWIVTHAATGALVAGCFTWPEALAYANQLGLVTDWRRPAADLTTDAVLKAYVAATRPTAIRGSHTVELNDPNDGNKVTGSHPRAAS